MANSGVARSSERTKRSERAARFGDRLFDQTNLCALLSAVVLVGLGANWLLGWWWADPVAGVGIAVLASAEARRAWRAEALEDTCCT